MRNKKNSKDEESKKGKPNNRKVIEPLIKRILEITDSKEATDAEKALGVCIACCHLAMFDGSRIFEVRNAIKATLGIKEDPGTHKVKDTATESDKVEAAIKAAIESVKKDPATTMENLDARLRLTVREAIKKIDPDLTFDMATIGPSSIRNDENVYGTKEINTMLFEASKKCMESKNLGDRKTAKVLAVLGIARNTGMIDRVLKDLDVSMDMYEHLAEILSEKDPGKRKEKLDEKMSSPDIDPAIKKQLGDMFKNTN